MNKYDKLVRDKISEIIKTDGKEYEVEIAPKEKRYTLLEDKLKKEVGEFLEDKNDT